MEKTLQLEKEISQLKNQVKYFENKEVNRASKCCGIEEKAMKLVEALKKIASKDCWSERKIEADQENIIFARALLDNQTIARAAIAAFEEDL